MIWTVKSLNKIDINEMLETARNMKASDLHLTKGLLPIVRVNGMLKPLQNYPILTDELLENVVEDMKSQMSFKGKGTDSDFSFVCTSGFRNRVNIFCQQGSPAVAVRLLSDRIPSMQELGLPSVFKDIAILHRGLVLVTGPTGSGKSTTLASVIDYINNSRSCHILTLEDPIEYAHKHKNCMVNQREIGRDTDSFSSALRSALREDPDVILVGEMRDLETISAAITAAETGHLVLSTLHTTGAAATVDRVIDVFPPHQQQQIRTQLASVLKAVISQQLLPKSDGVGRVAALEVLIATDAICNMIRENKCHQINSALQTGAKLGMQTMDMNLADLVSKGLISFEMASTVCMDKEALKRFQNSR